MEPARKKSIRNSVLITAWVGLLALGVIIQLSPSFALRVSPPPTKDLIEVGVTLESWGFARRRLANDVVWLPMPSDWPVHLYDRLYTGADSRIVLEFAHGTKLAIRANSLVRIDTRGDKPLIDLLQGELEVLSPGARGVVLRSGKEEVDVGPDQEPVVASHRKGHLELTKYRSEDAEPDAGPSKPKQAEVGDNSGWRPYPADGSYLLLQGTAEKKLKISVAPVCKSGCRLSIQVDGVLATESSFAAGEPPVAEITLQPTRSADYKLTFEDGASRSTLAFFTRAFSDRAFEEALARKAAVEILE